VSKELFKKCYEGTVTATNYAQIRLDQSIQEYGADKPVKYPETAYYLPVIYALEGTKVETLGQLVPILNKIKTECLNSDMTLEGSLLNGKLTLFAAEIIEACDYLDNEPYQKPWMGFVGDPILRAFGVPLVDGTIPGVAVIIGRARSTEEAAALVKNLQSKGILIIMCNEIIEQCIEADINIGPDYHSFPLGNFTQVIHAVNFAFRASLAFGGVSAGDEASHLKYQRDRVKVMVLNLGHLDIVRVAASFGAYYAGHPTITDADLGDTSINDIFMAEADYGKMVTLGMELRGIKVTTLDIDVPILIGPAFEGESIRKADMHCEFGGNKSTAFEWVTMVGDNEIEDGKVSIIGDDIDAVAEGGVMPLGIKVKIYGRKMQKDFESVFERRVHDYVNFGEGLWHMGQRDIVWARISKKAYAAGFRLKHLGEIIIAKFKYSFPAIIDRVEVEFYTDKAACDKEHAHAKEVYKARDDRMKGLTDEKVEDFYSCKLCQSFAPNHICIVTPERVGLCGAVNWLDARASNEMDPKGPNELIKRGEPKDAHNGIYDSVNEVIYLASNKNIEEVSLYSCMNVPQTSCGCFEAIIALFPEANGFMLTTREYSGLTPCGMSFSTLAGSVGGGQQTPGFMGIGRSYIISKKFIHGDGGLGRICWMPKSLKEYLKDDFIKVSEELGLGADFIDKIADEDVGHEPEDVMKFLEKVGHPALTMEPIA